MTLYNGVRLVDSPSPSNVLRLDMGCLPMVNYMNRVGIRVDIPHFRALNVKIDEAIEYKVAEIDYAIHDLVGHYVDPKTHGPFKVGSDDHVARLLFDVLHVQGDSKVRLTDSGARQSTQDEVISIFQGKWPIITKILDHRELKKLKTTYIEPIPSCVDSDGRMRTIFKHTRTRTGRLASGDKDEDLRNLQNIPVRSEWGKWIRNGFLASPGNVLVSGDLSQAEMRWAAHLSGDPVMSKVFRDRLDVHNMTACGIFKLNLAYYTDLAAKDERGNLSREEARVWKEFKHNYRLPSKTLGFGILYGTTGQGLQTQIANAGGPWWEEEKCDQLIRDWFKVYQGISDWMDEQHARAKRFGMVWDAFGRVRMAPGARSAHSRFVNAALREVGNMPVQASAQGSIKLAMAELWPISQFFNHSAGVCWPLLQIHDEVITEVKREAAEDYAREKRRVMEGAVPLDVPVLSSSDIAERWGDLK